MALRYYHDSEYEKVGRLKPDDAAGYIRIITDAAGEIGSITAANAELLLAGIEPQDAPPSGTADMSIPGTGFKVTIPSTDGQLYVAVARQVRNLLDKWPHKKAALFRPVWYGIDYWESVFSISEVLCNSINDINREWDSGILAGKVLIPISGTMKDFRYVITWNDKSSYYIQIEGGEPDMSYPSSWVCEPFSGGTCTLGGYARITGPAPGSVNLHRKSAIDLRGYSKVIIPWRLKAAQLYSGGLGWQIHHGAQTNYGLQTRVVDIATIKTIDGVAWWTNPSYPGWDVLSIPFQYVWSPNIYYFPMYTPGIANNAAYPGYADFEIGRFQYVRDCTTTGLVASDQYMIYDPEKKDYILDDNSLPVLLALYWRSSSGIGDAITTTAIQWYWDGAGTVFLSYDPVRIGPIMFDDEIRIDVQNGTDLRIRDYALGSERILHEGILVSRDTPDITSLCRPGINTITVSVRDSDGGGKVGYCTPVYVKRKR